MHHVDLVVSMMLRYAESHQLLGHFQDDLLKHDRKRIENMDGWRSFAWVVSKTSSDVFPIGLHPGFNDDVTGIAQIRVPSGAHCLWVNPERAKHEGSDVLVPVDLKGFERGVQSSRCYTYENGFITSQSGARVAQLRWDSMYCVLTGVTTCLYEMDQVMPGFSRTWGEQFALREVTRKHGLFANLYEKNAYFKSLKQVA